MALGTPDTRYIVVLVVVALFGASCADTGAHHDAGAGRRALARTEAPDTCIATTSDPQPAAETTSAQETVTGVDATDEQKIAELFGVKIVALRVSSAGYTLDLRYAIVNPGRKPELLDRSVKPCIIDQASGSRFMVVNPAKVGPLRQTQVTPDPKVTYFILFANPGKYIKPGTRVTLLAGRMRIENLLVE